MALVTEGKINWGDVNAEVYLIETASYTGNSGAPVYFYSGAEKEPGQLKLNEPILLKLAGVMSGTFLQSNPLAIVETVKTLVPMSNIGIAYIVPAYKLHEILFCDALKKKRGF